MNIFIKPGGEMIFLGDAPQELADLGTGTRRRASSIVPLHRGRRFLFLLLRAIFGERGITAEFTRSWQGPWLCVLFETGETFIHQSRRCCIKWEHERLEQLMEEE